MGKACGVVGKESRAQNCNSAAKRLDGCPSKQVTFPKTSCWSSKSGGWLHEQEGRGANSRGGVLLCAPPYARLQVSGRPPRPPGHQDSASEPELLSRLTSIWRDGKLSKRLFFWRDCSFSLIRAPHALCSSESSSSVPGALWSPFFVFFSLVLGADPKRVHKLPVWVRRHFSSGSRCWARALQGLTCRQHWGWGALGHSLGVQGAVLGRSSQFPAGWLRELDLLRDPPSSGTRPPAPTKHIRTSWEPVFPLPLSAETTSVYNCFLPGVGHSQATPAYSMPKIHGPATLSTSEILPILHSLSKTLVFDNRQIHSIS